MGPLQITRRPAVADLRAHRETSCARAASTGQDCGPMANLRRAGRKTVGAMNSRAPRCCAGRRAENRAGGNDQHRAASCCGMWQAGRCQCRADCRETATSAHVQYSKRATQRAGLGAARCEPRAVRPDHQSGTRAEQGGPVAPVDSATSESCSARCSFIVTILLRRAGSPALDQRLFLVSLSAWPNSRSPASSSR